jgi:drug/metabolite transporter (DMT)-like permease
MTAIADAAPAPAPAPAGDATLADWVRIVVPGFIWGASFLFIAEGLESFPPTLITPMRLAFGFATLGAFGASRRRIPRADLRRVAVLAVVWMAFPLSMFPFAEERVSSGVTGMLNGATPIFVAAVAAFIARRPPPRHHAVGLAVGSAGVVLIALPTLGEGSSSAVGVGLILLALASYGVALNLAVPLIQRHGSLPVMWRAQAVALVLTTPFALPHLDEVAFRWWPLVAIALLGVLGTAVAYAFAAGNAARLGSTRASITTYLIPVVAVALGALVRGERVALLALCGCAVTLLGAWLVGRRA